MENIVDFKQFDSMYDGKSYIALGRELYVDLETPVSIFLKVSKGKNSFLLESVEGGESIARYSFIGLGGYDKYFTNWFDIEVMLMYMKLYDTMKTTYEQKYKQPIDQHTLLFMIREVIRNNESRKYVLENFELLIV